MHELTRQREHEQLQAQIARTSRWLDDCCRPIGSAISSAIVTRQSFVAEAVFIMEASHPEAVSAMCELAAPSYAIAANGTVRNARHGAITWEPRSQKMMQLTDTFATFTYGHFSAAAYAVAQLDTFALFQASNCAELPSVIVDIIRDEPNSAVA